MKEPLGRIHPHGSGGKSVYQRAAQETNDMFTGFVEVIFGIIGIALLGLCLVGFIGFLASSGSAGFGVFGMAILGATAAMLN